MTARRPSYFSRLAPAAGDATVLPRLRPPRLLFRQSPAAEPFIEVPVRRTSVAPAMPPARAAAAGSPLAAPVGPPAAETASGVGAPAAHRTDRPAVAPPPASRPTTETADPARLATAAPQPAERRVDTRRAAAAATTAVGQSSRPALAVGEGKLPAPPVDATTAPVAISGARGTWAWDRRIGDIPGERAPTPPVDALTRRAATEPDMPPPRTARTAASKPAVPSEATAEPRGQRISHAPPASIPSPLRPAIGPAVTDAASGLRIGTLEVRVAAPSVPAPPQRIAAPPSLQAAVGPPVRICRPFASFGLGQS